ncbi:MAG: tetratricopeptide repeat protein [Alphaproteobacteria bacterium]|nr:tetratricopeptide repeat protein [Alphaproteobacteria bacterium]
MTAAGIASRPSLGQDSAMLEQARAHHRAGRLDRAERGYRQALKKRPGEPAAMHGLGLIALQRGDAAAAARAIGQALAATDRPEWRSDLGLALQAQGKIREAIEQFGLAGDAGLFNLGNALLAEGRVDEAVTAYRAAIAAQPDNLAARNNLANALKLLDRLAEADAVLAEALARAPDSPELLFNRAGVLSNLERDGESALLLQRALVLQPGYAAAARALGAVDESLGRLAEAEAAYRRAVEAAPAHVETWRRLGDLLNRLQRPAEAEPCFREATARDADFGPAHNGLGIALHAQARAEEAIACFRRALEIDPGHGDALNNLANALLERGEVAESVATYRRALALDPDHAIAHGGLIFALDHDPGATMAERQALRRAWYERFGRRLVSKEPFALDRDPDRRLRVGYVSADFRQHSAASLFGPVVRGHDPAQAEIICYSDVAREDAVTGDFKRAASQWRSTAGLSDQALAETIRRDRIDILVDLAGFSAGNRLGVFCRRPAPVQVSAWGHIAGTGIAVVDALLADASFLPTDVRPLFAEAVIDLPCAFAWKAPGYAPPVTMRDASDPPTLGYFNRLSKLSAPMIEVIGDIMRHRPQARLVIKDKPLSDPAIRARLLAKCEAAGIPVERVILLGASGHREHLAAFAEIDIALDPFPQGGGVSTLEALWMGVPVATLPGENVTSRGSLSILGALGLREWVADSPATFVDLAVDRLSRREDLARLRRELRPRLAASPICDMRIYLPAVEAAYRRLWRKWCESP